MNCGWRHVGIDCDPVAAVTVHNLENPVITPWVLKQLGVQIFIPVIALERSEDCSIE